MQTENSRERNDETQRVTEQEGQLMIARTCVCVCVVFVCVCVCRPDSNQQSILCFQQSRFFSEFWIISQFHLFYE